MTQAAGGNVWPPSTHREGDGSGNRRSEQVDATFDNENNGDETVGAVGVGRIHKSNALTTLPLPMAQLAQPVWLA